MQINWRLVASLWPAVEADELSAILPAILDRVFKGEL